MDDFKMPDMNGLLQAAQKMQQDLARVQSQLDDQQVEASAGGGMVTVTVTGRLDVVAIKIDPAVIDPKDAGMLQDLVVAAVNQALAKAKKMAQDEMSKATGGMSIPGLTP